METQALSTAIRFLHDNTAAIVVTIQRVHLDRGETTAAMTGARGGTRSICPGNRVPCPETLYYRGLSAFIARLARFEPINVF